MIMADRYMGFEEIQVWFQKQLCYTFNFFCFTAKFTQFEFIE